jgi:hypothetical protein
MPTYPSDSPPVTVAAMLERPQLLARDLTSLAAKKFVADRIFMRGPSSITAGGSVDYQESESIYPDRDLEEVAPRAEFPMTGWSEVIKTATVKKYGLQAPIAFESVRRNRLDQLIRAQRKLANATVRFVDTKAMALLVNSAAIEDVGAVAVWSDTANAKPINDIAKAIMEIELEEEGYDADTLVINPINEYEMLINAQLLAALPREDRDGNVQTGRVAPILGLRQILVTSRIAEGRGLVLEARTVGTIADEQPENSEGYVAYDPGAEQANLWVKVMKDDDHDEWRVRAARFPLMFVAEPGAAKELTGI